MIDLGGDVCGNGISKLVFTILSAVAENERDRIRDVKRHLASQGVYGGGKRPFGFDVMTATSSQTLLSKPRSRV
jgi:putative DNA-invertase from lambdoid prophage Rac